MSFFGGTLVHAGISSYRRWVSPHKRYACAFASAGLGNSCSAHGLELIENEKSWIGFREKMEERLRKCQDLTPERGLDPLASAIALRNKYGPLAGLSFYATAFVFAGSGCGGGGGATSSSPATGTSETTPAISSLPATTPTTTTVPDLPAFSAADARTSAYTRIAEIRSGMGISAVSRNAALELAELSHANYVNLNFYKNETGAFDFPSNTLSLHSESPGNPGFTGITSSDRATATGFRGGAGEVLAFPSLSSANACIDAWINTVFHRTSMTALETTDIGFSLAVTPDGLNSTCGLTTGSLNPPIIPTGVAALYPWANQTNVATRFGGETPDPVPSSPTKGNPVTIQIGQFHRLTVSSFSLTATNAGTLIPVKLITQSDFPDFLSQNTAAIVPLAPLDFGKNYTAKFSGTDNGVALEKIWNFTTAQLPVPSLVASSSSLGSTVGSTVNVSAIGGTGSTAFFTYSDYLSSSGNFTAKFATFSYPAPGVIKLTRTATPCSNGLTSCAQVVKATDQLSGIETSIKITVN